MTKPLSGKRGLIMGVANDRSIAWGIARALHQAGAELAFTYQGEAFERRVAPLAAEIGAEILVDLDVTDPASMDSAFATLSENWPSMDFVVHAIAFADKAELAAEFRFRDTTRENFAQAMDISCFSFIDVARRASEMMPDGGTLLTLTFEGSTRVFPAYQVGERVIWGMTERILTPLLRGIDLIP